MSLKLTVGLNKKIGQPDYGSLGACCSVDFELDAHVMARKSKPSRRSLPAPTP